MASLTFMHSYMQQQLQAQIQRMCLLRSAADAIEALNIDALEIDYLREIADSAEARVYQLELDIRDAAGRLALISRGYPDPGLHATA